ncbi:MAG: LemA family protein [Oscillospiraceae bacterium]|nr:LemA family protein [Oscillospiraceae bacterium]
MWIVIGIGGFVLLSILIFIGMYNRLVRLRNIMEKSQSGICVYLQQRFDLIPNLINVVKGYMKHEREVLNEIAQLRTTAMTDMKAANALNAKMTEMFAVAESNPDLKASEQFLQLQHELSKMENQLQAARRAYNLAVNNMNTAIEIFPSSIIAGMYGFKRGVLFESAEAIRENIRVEF